MSPLVSLFVYYSLFASGFRNPICILQFHIFTQVRISCGEWKWWELIGLSYSDFKARSLTSHCQELCLMFYFWQTPIIKLRYLDVVLICCVFCCWCHLQAAYGVASLQELEPNSGTNETMGNRSLTKMRNLLLCLLITFYVS